jgi:hypothetical protein
MDEKNPDALVADSMAKLFGSMGSATANPLTATAKPSITGKFRIAGTITRENGTPAAGVSIGMMGTETTTDQEGKFSLLVEK